MPLLFVNFQRITNLFAPFYNFSLLFCKFLYRSACASRGGRHTRGGRQRRGRRRGGATKLRGINLKISSS